MSTTTERRPEGATKPGAAAVPEIPTLRAPITGQPAAPRMAPKSSGGVSPKPPQIAPAQPPAAAPKNGTPADPASARKWRIDPRDLSPDPLLNCLYEMTRILGKPLSREALVSGLPLAGEPMTPRLVLRAANRAGFVARIAQHTVDRRMAPLCPAIVLLSDERAMLVTEIDRERNLAHIIYPQAPGEPVEMALADIEAQSTGYVISIKNKYAFEHKPQEHKTSDGQHWFWGTLAKPWKIYRDVLVASVLVNLFALIVPLYSMNIYDRVIPNNAQETLWTFSIGVMAILGFDLLMKVLRGWFIDLASKRVDQHLSSLIMNKVMGIRMEAKPASVGSFAANLRAFESVREFMTSASIGMLVDVPFALIFLGAIAALGNWLVVPPAVAIISTVLLAVAVRSKMKPLTESQQSANQQKHASLIEGLISLETVKALNVEGRIQKRWEEANAFLAVSGGKIKLLSSLAVNGTGLITQSVTIAMIIVGVYLIADNALTQGALIACTQLAGRAIAPLGQLSSLLIQYENAASAYQGVNRIMDMPEERPANANFVLRSRLRGALGFHNVGFKYPNADTASLTGVNLNIQVGERIGIIGKVGSGKSTLEKLMLGLYQPSSGTLSFDGVDSKQIDPTEIRSIIGYVPQDVLLFQGTLRENIAISAPWADDTMIMKAAAIAGLNSLISRHPKGLHLPIGERGDSLSGGQRQAVALARALIHEPALLILDEPTSAMDNETESQVLNNLRHFVEGRTLILITHRMSLLEMVDRLIVVDQGRIVADGPKDKVIAALSGSKA